MYRLSFYENSEFIIYHIKILEAPEQIEHEIGSFRLIDLEWEKPAVIQCNLSNNNLIGLKIVDVLIILYDLEIIEGCIEFRFNGSIYLILTRKRIKIFSLKIVQSEYELVAL